ncbi:uncharacterized protein LOC129597208 isoform X1 [Paramacrobiotus metropolitanus]|uniref:uncharacterized protein LOC129597208 isoform X1 n=1 Tax=Paramacrobiotus metropolitanus TaxID=2943436 RepID=UPI0024462C2E|nr:uncharacterized protein LOC129597208 isoform X1 [Paramacrobiotus metropolitanus]
MDGVLVLPAHRPIYANALYDPFVVDVKTENGSVCRGYVCGTAGKKELCIRLGSLEKIQYVPFNRITKPHPCMETLSLSDDDKNVEILLSLNENQPESWQQARILKIKRSPSYNPSYSPSYSEYAMAKVELCGPHATSKPTTLNIMSGSSIVSQNLRRLGLQGTPVTADTFRQVQMPMFEPSEQFPYPEEVIRKAKRFPWFGSEWLYMTGTMFLNSDRHSITVLFEGYSHLNIKELKTLLQTEKHPGVFRILRALTWFSEEYLKKVYLATRNVLNGLVIAAESEVLKVHGEPSFMQMPLELHLLILSELDIYNQHYFKRVGKVFVDLLSSKFLRKCAIIPDHYPRYSKKHRSSSTDYGLHEDGFMLNYDLSHALADDLSIIYLTCRWGYSMFDFLGVFHRKLDWFVIAHDKEFFLDKFINVPNERLIWNCDVLTPLAFNQICHRIVLKNCLFDSSYSICYKVPNRKLEPNYDDAHWKLNCSRNPLFIHIPCWSYSFPQPTQESFEYAICAMLEKFCPKVTECQFDTLMSWLDTLTDEELRDGPYSWAWLCVPFWIWQLPFPEDIHALRFQVRNPETIPLQLGKLVLQSMILMLPASYSSADSGTAASFPVNPDTTLTSMPNSTAGADNAVTSYGTFKRLHIRACRLKKLSKEWLLSVFRK